MLGFQPRESPPKRAKATQTQASPGPAKRHKLNSRLAWLALEEAGSTQIGAGHHKPPRHSLRYEELAFGSWRAVPLFADLQRHLKRRHICCVTEGEFLSDNDIITDIHPRGFVLMSSTSRDFGEGKMRRDCSGIYSFLVSQMVMVWRGLLAQYRLRDLVLCSCAKFYRLDLAALPAVCPSKA
ncbi:hypothetical protein FOPE_07689 [Fonsecaea pedrosoi]|nr:hypothetical protein FOPE_07689 [Fonsecaea pedrosoi]